MVGIPSSFYTLNTIDHLFCNIRIQELEVKLPNVPLWGYWMCGLYDLTNNNNMKVLLYPKKWPMDLHYLNEGIIEPK
jgi:hypothetical protein